MASILQIFEDPSFYSGVFLIIIGIVLRKMLGGSKSRQTARRVGGKVAQDAEGADVKQRAEDVAGDAIQTARSEAPSRTSSTERLAISVSLISILVGLITIGISVYDLLQGG